MAVKRGKKQARRSGESSVPGYVWLLTGLLVGAAVAVTLYVKMPHAIDDMLPHPNPTAHPATASDSGVAPEGGVASVHPAEPKKPQYDFYKLLPEKEVVIPDEELSAQVKAEAAAKLASQQQTVQPVTPGSAASAAPSGTTPTTTNGVATASQSTTASSIANVAPASGDNGVAPTPSAATPEKTGQYLLQAGAFRNNVQADDLKARIAMLGLVGHVETVQTPSGEMHRVRLGPYATASELNAAKQKLNSNGMQPVAVRVK